MLTGAIAATVGEDTVSFEVIKESERGTEDYDDVYFLLG